MAFNLALGLSALFTTSRIGGIFFSPDLRRFRRISTTSRSACVTPSKASVTKRITFASSIAISACSRISWIKSAEPIDKGFWECCLLGSMPPVSTTKKSCPAQSPSATSRSRVVPGTSSTIANRCPTKRLKSVLLPTFGLPTRTTTDFCMRDFLIFLFQRQSTTSMVPGKMESNRSSSSFKNTSGDN